ncbi:MAG: ThuA domain-containing protein, partial [Candidatus Hydrogenedentes bacterium]|nr:ThuA domain-containing protein [Candidatus Hydrogenedentota bacterium]
STGNKHARNIARAPAFAVSVFICLAWCGSAQTAVKSGRPPVIITRAMSIEHANLPRGYEMAAYVDCGPQQDSGARPEGRIRLVTGTTYIFPGVRGPLADVAFDASAVQYEITGLEAEEEYILGFTWWDVDNAGRVQSVKFGTGEPVKWTTVLPPVRAAAYYHDKPTWAHVLLPITAEFRKDGRLLVSFAKEAGPNAVVNELWLLKKTEPTPSKRVLIVTGDDYPGHFWRETGPELARILREDARLEVSITECPAIYGSPLMTYYDATVLHFKNYAERLPLSAEIGEGLVRFAESGRGVVLVHFACGAFQEWDGFEKLVGRVWNPKLRAHDPYGAFTVRIEDANHPATKGMKPFEVTDELYTCLDGEPEIGILCAATSKVDQKDYPIAFIVPAFPKVFHSVLGHGIESLQSEGMRALYRRAAAWAAGLEPGP